MKYLTFQIRRIAYRIRAWWRWRGKKIELPSGPTTSMHQMEAVLRGLEADIAAQMAASCAFFKAIPKHPKDAEVVEKGRRIVAGLQYLVSDDSKPFQSFEGSVNRRYINRRPGGSNLNDQA